MRHVPHLLLDGPWDHQALALPAGTLRHLHTVLRMSDGDPCSYTDGAGLLGAGVLRGSEIERGDESLVEAPPTVVLAVAPPGSKDRLRWMIEKVCEVGVSRVRWLRTAHGEGRIPRHDKAVAWARMAVEQSQRAHLPEVDDRWTSISELTGPLVAFDRGGITPAGVSAPVTVLVGPEGGWAPDELPDSVQRVTLGDGILRTETAAIVGVHTVLAASR